MREGRHLGRVVEHERDDGRVVVAVHDEAEPLEPEAQIARIEGQPLQPLFPLPGTQLPGDDAQRGRDLRHDEGTGRLAVDAAGVADAQLVDDGSGRGDVAAVGPEGFRQRAHQDVDFGRVDAEVIADAAAAGAQGTDGVGFVHEEVEFVFFLQRDDAR